MKTIIAKSVNQYSTLTELLSYRADSDGEKNVYTFLNYTDGGKRQEAYLSFIDLERKSKNIAALLQSYNAKGERALLLFPPGLDYIIAFFACLYAGVIAVPAYSTLNEKQFKRIDHILSDSKAKYILTNIKIVDDVKLKFDKYVFYDSLVWITTDCIDDYSTLEYEHEDINNDTIAFLQYTSGSTSRPKGTIITHNNIMHNELHIQECFKLTSADRLVSWLPPYHDMGLIGNIFPPIINNLTLFMLSPFNFLLNPFHWLEAISDFRGTANGGPNFAYDHCVRSISNKQKEDLDLSSWDLAYNGAEPIRADTLDRFYEAFKQCGLRREALFPCYGLAENTLLVCGWKRSTPPLIKTFVKDELQKNNIKEADYPFNKDDVQNLVASGIPEGDGMVVIIDPDTQNICQPDKCGEVWVSGKSVSQGYWNWSLKDNEQIFRAYTKNGEGPFLRTGDLGFLKDGFLYITSRLKDLIIIRGKNYFPQDIEYTVENCHDSFRKGSTAAFSVDINDEERIVIIQEINKHYVGQIVVKKIVNLIQKAVYDEHSVKAYDVVLVNSSIPKTSSGKIQRQLCKSYYLDGKFSIID